MSGAAACLRGRAFDPPLPGVLSDLVERVVRGTWLWPSEKRDVRAELESHFREGLFELTQEGRSLDESVSLLREEFGDPALAAKLIRRGKKRGRPMFWKILVSTLTVFVVALGAGAGYLTYVTLGKPTPSVDYVAKINEPIEIIPLDRRAWPPLRDVLFEILPQLDKIGGKISPLPMPGDADWTGIHESVLAARPFVPKIISAVNQPFFGYVYGKEGTEYLPRRNRVIHPELPAADGAETDPLVPPTIAILLPHLSDLRAMGKFMVLNARDLLRQGDFASAWQSLDAAEKLGSHLVSGRTLIEQLVGVAVLNLATREMQSALYQMRDVLTAEQWAAVRASHVMTMPVEGLKPNLKCEQFFFEDVVQYVFTDDGNGNGRLIPGQFGKICGYVSNSGGPTGDDSTDPYCVGIAAVHADRRETLAKYDDLLERAVEYWSLPLYDPRRAEGNMLLQRLKDNPSDSRRFALVCEILPSLSRADQLIRETAMFRMAARTVIALLGYRRDHHAWPERLTELTPGYLCDYPVDAYSGLALRYQASPDGQMKLYSVGRNLEDNGGSSEKIVESMHSSVKTEADWVFWPAS